MAGIEAVPAAGCFVMDLSMQATGCDGSGVGQDCVHAEKARHIAPVWPLQRGRRRDDAAKGKAAVVSCCRVTNAKVLPCGLTLYNSIGTTYTSFRNADPRIAAAIDAALGGVASVVNVGVVACTSWRVDADGLAGCGVSFGDLRGEELRFGCSGRA